MHGDGFWALPRGGLVVIAYMFVSFYAVVNIVAMHGPTIVGLGKMLLYFGVMTPVVVVSLKALHRYDAWRGESDAA